MGSYCPIHINRWGKITPKCGFTGNTSAWLKHSWQKSPLVGPLCSQKAMTLARRSFRLTLHWLSGLESLTQPGVTSTFQMGCGDPHSDSALRCYVTGFPRCYSKTSDQKQDMRGRICSGCDWRVLWWRHGSRSSLCLWSQQCEAAFSHLSGLRSREGMWRRAKLCMNPEAWPPEILLLQLSLMSKQQLQLGTKFFKHMNLCRTIHIETTILSSQKE